MGAWGTAIFSDDTALDVRDEWRDAILDGLSAEEATAHLQRLRRTPSLSIPFDVGDVVRVYEEDGANEALVVVVGHMDTRERDPVVAAVDWGGGLLPAPDALSRLSVLPDPYAPDRKLLIWVTTLAKGDVFGAHVGEVVAKGVTPGEPLDLERIAHSMNWRLVPGSVHEAQLQARQTRAAGL
jgi:hypothetical protein